MGYRDKFLTHRATKQYSPNSTFFQFQSKFFRDPLFSHWIWTNQKNYLTYFKKCGNPRKSAVSEIKVLFCAPTGCISPKTMRPEIYPCTLLICSNDKQLKKWHTPGAHLRKSCALSRKCARRAQGAPLISDTGLACCLSRKVSLSLYNFQICPQCLQFIS